MHELNRTPIEYSDLTIRFEILGKCSFKRTIPLWNTLPRKIKNEKEAFETMKENITRVEHFTEKLIKTNIAYKTNQIFSFSKI